MPKRPTARELSRARDVESRRQCWAGLRVSAESLLAGLDRAPEVVTLTSGTWSVVKLLTLALARVGHPAQVDCWSWTFSRRAIARLTDWHRDGVYVRVVVDSSLWRRQPAYGEALVAGSMADQVRAISSHAKVARVVGPQGAIFVAGSGNANLCRRAELLWLSRDARLSTWLADLTDRVFEAIPAGAPVGDTRTRDAALARAFPRPSSVPSWAAGVSVLGRGR